MQISMHPANDMESVYKFIPKEYFASDMGGNAPSFEAKKGINTINITYKYLYTYKSPIISSLSHTYIKLTAFKMKHTNKQNYARFKKLIL